MGSRLKLIGIVANSSARICRVRDSSVPILRTLFEGWMKKKGLITQSERPN